MNIFPVRIEEIGSFGNSVKEESKKHSGNIHKTFG